MTPVYVVSGFPRSGTSMLMRCLEVGGIECVYDTQGDANRNRNTLIADYVPNPNGFYEDAPLSRPDWSEFRGKAVKVVMDNLSLIPPGTYCRVAYMRRNPAEIRRSYYGILSGPHSDSVYRFLDGYWDKVRADENLLRADGHDVTTLDYAEVVANPTNELRRLGWPFNVEGAAAAVDPTLYRHRGAS